MFNKKILAGLFMAASLLSANTLNAKELRVATNPTFPPFEFVDTHTQQITGFEVQLIEAMAKKAGYDVVPVKLGFDAIIPAILSGTVDVGASGFSVTPERKKRVLFTEPFYKSGLTILITKNNEGKINNFADLKGKKLAVQIGTVAYTKAKTIEGAQVKTFNHSSDAILELGIGGADAVINDKPVTDYILTQQPRIANATIELPEMLSSDDMAMVVSKKNPELVKQLDKALAELKADGTYEQLYVKWFGKKPQ